MRKPRKGDLWQHKESGIIFYIIGNEKDKYHVMAREKAFVGNHLCYRDCYIKKSQRYEYLKHFEDAFKFIGRAKGKPEDIFIVKK